MSTIGQSGIFYRKRDTETQKTPAIGFKKIKGFHEAVGGETSIDLNSLTLPASTPGFVNPSASDITAAKLVFNEKNLTIHSSVSGTLDWDDYTVTSNTTISLKTVALAGELYSIIIDPVIKTGLKAIDADPVVVTGVLAISATEFIVGTPFDVNKYNSQKQGSILVFLDGILQSRNSGNAINNPGGDGDYHEVDNGGRIGTIIRFNVSSGSARDVMIVSNGLAFSAPDDSYKAVIESLAGQVDAMIPTLAGLAGVPTTDFQSAPNYQDLKAFGDRVTKVERVATPTESGLVIMDSTATTNAVGEYEEGTWNPVESTKTNLTGTPTFGTAKYTRVGRTVHCSIDSVAGYTITSAGSTRTLLDLTVTGLPGFNAPTSAYGSVSTRLNASPFEVVSCSIVSGASAVITISFDVSRAVASDGLFINQISFFYHTDE